MQGRSKVAKDSVWKRRSREKEYSHLIKVMSFNTLSVIFK